jgi:iron(III) transport system ATP-binding protein
MTDLIVTGVHKHFRRRWRSGSSEHLRRRWRSGGREHSGRHGRDADGGSVHALAGVDLTVPSGLLVAVLGPSGCGKTTLLRCLAGFERIDEGSIRLGSRLVAGPGRHTPPHRRRFAIVPQEGALFPHLSVAGNVAYGLDRAARQRGRVDEVLELVGLAGYGRRMPHELSGGQQQRVAVARALAPRPEIILLDEPFSALDAHLRAELRRDIRQALQEDGATAILVTHDQEEALSLADQVAVMRDGRVVQQGTPTEVYRTPVDAWVGGFVGGAVLLPGVPSPAGVRTVLGDLALRGAPPSTSALTVLLRPEQIVVGPPAPDAVPATVVARDFHGHDALLTLRLADEATTVAARVLSAADPPSVGDRVGLRVTGPASAWPA